MRCMQALKTRLSEAVGEARAFAVQQKADAERTKRTYSQVTAGLHDGRILAPAKAAGHS